MTFFDGRPGAAKVEELITSAAEGKCKLLMSVVNWGEVYYSVWRAKGPGMVAKSPDIAHLPIELVDARYELTKLAANSTPTTNSPTADCFRRRASHRSQSLPRHQRRPTSPNSNATHPPPDPLISPSRHFAKSLRIFGTRADQTKRPGGLLGRRPTIDCV